MAKKTAKGDLERIVSVSLRRDFIKVPRGKRCKRAVNKLRKKIAKSTKTKNVKISQKVNEAIWRSGSKKPLGNIKIKVKKEGELATARLPDEKVEVAKKEVKSRLDKLKEGISKDSTIGKKLEQVSKKAKTTETKREEVKDRIKEPVNVEKPEEIKSESQRQEKPKTEVKLTETKPE